MRGFRWLPPCTGRRCGRVFAAMPVAHERRKPVSVYAARWYPWCTFHKPPPPHLGRPLPCTSAPTLKSTGKGFRIPVPVTAQ
jgi:hypothetical protein